jgi:NhaA family Na+:H+ antiporter
MVALVVPVRPAMDPGQFIATTSSLLKEIDGPDNSLDALIHDSKRRNRLNQLGITVEEAIPPGIAMEHRLHPLMGFVILPLFALFSAGVAFDAQTFQGFPTAVSLGVIFGLVLGKPLGVLLTSWLVIRIAKPDLGGLTLPMLLGAGCLAGIGFTMAIFISELAYASETLINQAKVGVLIASALAALLGALVLHFSLPRGDATAAQ